MPDGDDAVAGSVEDAAPVRGDQLIDDGAARLQPASVPTSSRAINRCRRQCRRRRSRRVCALLAGPARSAPPRRSIATDATVARPSGVDRYRRSHRTLSSAFRPRGPLWHLQQTTGEALTSALDSGPANGRNQRVASVVMGPDESLLIDPTTDTQVRQWEPVQAPLRDLEAGWGMGVRSTMRSWSILSRTSPHGGHITVSASYSDTDRCEAHRNPANA